MSGARGAGPVRRVVALGVLLVAQVAALGVSVVPPTGGRGSWPAFAALGVGVAAWAVSLRLLRGLARGAGRRAATRLVVAGQLLLVLAALAAPPAASDDANRYVWDGDVQAAGIDPYRYVPLDPALSGVRTPYLFPGGRDCARDVEAFVPGPQCTVINRPTVPTIYPPVAEAEFWLVSRVPWGRGGVLAFQVAGGLAVLAVGLLVLRRAGPVAGATWGWFPLVLTGLVNDAHVDGLAALCTVLAVLAAGRARPWRAGLWLGAAVATKLTPGVVAPAFVRNRVVRVGVAAVAVVAVSYLPHVLAVGPAVLGYLPGYLSEEGYEAGDRFLLLDRLLGPQLHGHDTAAALAVLVVLAAVAAWRADPAAPERSALLMAGGALLVTTPAYTWYGAVAVAMAALSGRPRWAAVALAPVLSYSGLPVLQPLSALGDTTGTGTAGWALALAVVVGGASIRACTRSPRSRPAACSSAAAAGSDRPGPPPRGTAAPPGRDPADREA